MLELALVLLMVLIVGAGVTLSVFLVKREIRTLREKKEEDPRLNLFQQEMKEMREESGRIIRDFTFHIKDVASQLEKVHNDHQHVLDVKAQLGKLTDVLANPKQRGILGEYFLETLLKNVFQPNQYQLQYQFRDGETVDAVIFIKNKVIPIDSKFSLENYNKILEEKEPEKREKLEKIFKQDLKNRIDETAKYIRPEEGTMDFAFMFVPSEGVYYDLLINKIGAIKISTYDLIEYAFKEKHVAIVSPTSFYAYLQTVLQGLRALQIEESAKEIRKQVEGLQKHLLNYDSFLQRLGNNLSAAVNTYNQAYREFGKIDKDVVKITGREREIEPLQLEKPEQ